MYLTLLTDNAIQILQSRYLRKNEQGAVVETPEQMFLRVARCIAAVEKQFGDQEAQNHWEEVFFKILRDLDFLPNSPTLMNAGLPHGQLSACFVLPIEDSLNSIFETLKSAALIHQSGGGTGFNFSSLRPKGDLVHSGGVSSGPVSFIRIFDASTEYIRRGGRRRGANMGILHIDHPDIEEFILAKGDKKSLRNFNLSVNITDDFMEAVENNSKWSLHNPRTGQQTRTLPARQLWNQIIDQAWQTGDPGLLFIDTINSCNPTPALGNLTCTNPCGEVPLLPYESCNLGSINLSNMLKTENGLTTIDYLKLEKTIQICIRFLDNVIEANHFPLQKIHYMTHLNRKIGLGVMGWAEMLIRLNIPYASDEAVDLGRQLMQFIDYKSRLFSSQLAEQRGVFPSWDRSIYAPNQLMRNATRTSIAPTGSISILANTTSSIEPLFALTFRRVGILNHQIQKEVSHIFKQKAQELGIWSDQLARHIFSKGALTNFPALSAEVMDLFRTSLEIPWEFHIRHQAAFQQYTDNAVSKTINFSSSATRGDIEEAFKMAWQMKIKGITIYRCGSRQDQVLLQGMKKKTTC